MLGNKKRRNKKRLGRDSSRRRFLGQRRSLFELLEDRRLLAGGNIFAQFVGDVATSGERVEIPIAISTPDFTFRGSDTLLGFHVRGTNGLLDPAAVEIRNNSGSILPAIYSATDLSGSLDSLTLAQLSTGSYSVFIADEGNGIGPFQLDVFLVGDADGNRAVERADADIIRGIFGALQSDANYVVEADANLDARITSFDLFQWQINSSDSTDIAPLSLTAIATVGGDATSRALDDELITISGVTSPVATVELDTDGDGAADLTTAPDPDGSYSFQLSFSEAGLRTLSATARDSFGQRADVPVVLDIEESFQITEVSPADGEALVSLTREAIIRFSERVDPATITPESVQFIALGQDVPGRLAVSSTERFVTFFPQNPWPASTEIRIAVDGSLIQSRNGDRLDADRDGASGGMEQADFRTLPLTRIQGTDVWGYVYDSYNLNTDGSNVPIVGATIRVDAFPEANAVTDDNGYFILHDMPAPAFFVHVDGTTAINAPAGTIYPSVGKPFHSVPGQSTQLNMQGVPFNVYLPPMSIGDVQALSASEDTVVGFGAGGLAELAAMFPEIDPAIWQQVAVTYPAGSAIDDQGNVATQAIILPVPPNRIPAPLPPNMHPKLVISVQAMGATNFDVPAPVTFPNLDGLAPGEKSLIFSFNHDAGRWDVIGTGTVSTDGLMVVSDPGVGILAPGWHFTDPTTVHEGEVEEPTPKTVGSMGDVGSAAFEAVRRAAAQFFNTGAFLISGFDTFAPVLGQVPGIDQGMNLLGEQFGVLADVIDDGSIGVETWASVSLALAGTLDLDPITGTVLDATGFALDTKGLADSSFATAAAFMTFAEALSNALTDWERTIVDLANETSTWVAHTDNFLSGLEDIRIARTAANTQATSDPAIVAQFRRGFEAILDARHFLTEQAPFSAAAALRDIQAGYVQFMEDFARVYSDLFQPASGASYTVSTASGTIVASGTTDGAGKFNAALPPDSTLFITVASPLTGQVITNVINTGSSGSSSSSRTFIVPIVGTDTDGEGLLDEAERVIGTSLTLADTDGDGLNDRAEIEQGLDPLSNLAFPTGIIASLPLLGEAREVVVEGSTLDAIRQTAYVATGSHGLAIVDSSVFNNPIVLGQLDLPGDAVDVAVDSRLRIAAVAAGSGGLHLVDVTDPVQAVLIQTVASQPAQVELFDGVAYVAAGTKLQSFSLITGELLQTLSLGGGLLTGLAREGSLFITMDELRNLRAVDISSGVMMVRGVLQLPQGGGQVFIGNGVAYAAASPTFFRGGFATADVSDPDVLALISGSDVVSPSIVPGRAVIANGSGLGVVVGGRSGAFALDVLDVSDPQLTNVFLSRVPLSVEPWSVALAGGIAFVADGTSGLQVVNFLPFDNLAQVPAVALSSPVADADPETPGVQVVEGSSILLRADVTDDVQVRNVELIVNGQVVRNDVSFPFDLSAIALGIDPNPLTVTVQARATDTGGNRTLSDPLTFNLVPDTIAPALVSANPADGTLRAPGLSRIELIFSEPLAAATVTPNTFRLMGPAGAIAPPTNVRLRVEGRVVELTYDPLPEGAYQLVIAASQVTDRAGNALDSADLMRSFTLAMVSNAWVNASGGAWEEPSNWSRGAVPTDADDVSITLPGTYTITLNSAVALHSLTLGAVAGAQTLVSDFNLTLAEDSVVQARGVLNLSSNANLTLGGQLRVDGEFDKSGGITTGDGELIVAQDGELFLNGSAVVNVAVSNEGVLLVRGSDNALNGALTTAVGSVLVVDAAPTSASLTIAAGFINRGTIRLTKTGPASNVSIAPSLFVSSGTLVNAPGATIYSGTQNAFVMSGRITAQIENQGVLRAEDPLTILNQDKTFISSAGTINTDIFFNNGLAIQGGTTVLGVGTSFLGWINLSGTLNLVSDFTINGQLTVGGQVNGPGTLINPTTLRLNSATVNATVDNRPNGMLYVLSGVNTINGTFTTTANSNLQLGGTSTLSVSSGFTNNGTITFAEDGALAVMGTLVNSPGGVIWSSNLGGSFTRNLSAALDNQGILNVAKSLKLNGADTQHRNSGTINIDAGQVLNVNGGSFEQTPSGTVNLKFASLSLFGKLIVSGEARLEGTLRTELVGGFIPLAGDSFEVMTYGSRMGEYATVDGGTVDYSTNYGANSLVLTVVAPAAALTVELAGDYNGDGTVDADDYTVYRDTLGQIVPKFSLADGNGDGIVDKNDYHVLKANFGNSQFLLSSSVLAAIPNTAAAASAVALPSAPLDSKPLSDTAGQANYLLLADGSTSQQRSTWLRHVDEAFSRYEDSLHAKRARRHNRLRSLGSQIPRVSAIQDVLRDVVAPSVRPS